MEVIIVHDIQDSKTSAELLNLVERHKGLRIIFIEGEYGSPGAARNVGLDLLNGNWVAFWDSDDLPEVSNVMRAVDTSAPIVEVIIGNFVVEEGEERILCEHKRDLNRVALNPGLWRMVFKASVFNEIRFENLRMGEDQLVLISLNLMRREIEFVNQVFYKYVRGHPTQLTSNQSAKNEVSITLLRLLKLIEDNPALKNNFSELVKFKLFLSTVKNKKSFKKRLRRFLEYRRTTNIKIDCT